MCSMLDCLFLIPVSAASQLMILSSMPHSQRNVSAAGNFVMLLDIFIDVTYYDIYIEAKLGFASLCSEYILELSLNWLWISNRYQV